MNDAILIVDDQVETADLLADVLRKRRFEATAVHSADAAKAWLRTHPVDIVLTDVGMPGTSGIELCEWLRERHPNILPIVVTGMGDVETAIAAVRAGAYDYLTKPAKADVVEIALRRALEHLGVRQEANRLRSTVFDNDEPIPNMAGTSLALREMTSMIRRVANSDATVLITGESGTGKELVARACHALSSRAKQPFVAINCGAMPANLLESELFGHVQGAFTDAKTSRAGLFVQAGRGTIFLDEIGEMPLDMQVKLLRVLQERTVRPVGGDREIPIDARVVTATNRDLESEIEAKRFREDLYYRINVVAITVPPLRDRPGDVGQLAKHILGRIAQRSGKPQLAVAPDALRRMTDYSWPGNIRELENSLERAAAVSRGGEITVEDLPAKVQTYKPERFELVTATPEEMVTLDEMERRYVRQVLLSVGGNKTHAARILGIDRRSLYRRLETATPASSNPPT